MSRRKLMQLGKRGSQLKNKNLAGPQGRYRSNTSTAVLFPAANRSMPTLYREISRGLTALRLAVRRQRGGRLGVRRCARRELSGMTAAATRFFPTARHMSCLRADSSLCAGRLVAAQDSL